MLVACSVISVVIPSFRPDHTTLEKLIFLYPTDLFLILFMSFSHYLTYVHVLLLPLYINLCAIDLPALSICISCFVYIGIYSK